MPEPGRIAYEAYCESNGCKSLVSGDRLPGWDELKDEIKTAWDAAAKATVGFVDSKLSKLLEKLLNQKGDVEKCIDLLTQRLFHLEKLQK